MPESRNIPLPEDITTLPGVSLLPEFGEETQQHIEGKRTEHITKTAGHMGEHAVKAADMQWDQFNKHGIRVDDITEYQKRGIRLAKAEMMRAAVADTTTSISQLLMVDDLDYYRTSQGSDRRSKNSAISGRLAR